MRLTLLLTTIFLFASGRINAHPLDMGLIQFEITDSIKGSIDLNATLVSKMLHVPEATEEILKSKREDIFNLTLGSGTLSNGGTPCTWGEPNAFFFGQSVRVTNEAKCEGPLKEELVLTVPFARSPELPSTFHLLFKGNFFGEEKILTFPEGIDLITLNLKTQNDFIGFVLMGIKHIGAHPSEWHDSTGVHFPEGIDHILFVLGLVLMGGGLWGLLKTATGFTLGHSITLALGATGIMSLPARFTESVIALSIAYVALEAVLQKRPKNGFLIAAGFGLIHGFGFASALTDLNLSGRTLAMALLGFNLGVEIGQLTIVLISLPFLLSLEKYPKAKLTFVRIFGSGIFLIATYWFIQRAFAL